MSGGFGPLDYVSVMDERGTGILAVAGGGTPNKASDSPRASTSSWKHCHIRTVKYNWMKRASVCPWHTDKS